ncbi:MAG: alpha/beta fold hydrolase [Kiritimatiellaeota bacterium]|nr:alpha/beta fold hydrolase [Kiritimatiellota bacterium]
MSSVSQQLSQPPYTDLGDDQHLTTIFASGVVPTRLAWKRRRAELLQQVRRVLGKPSFRSFVHDVEVVDRWDQPDCLATLVRQATGPKTRQLLLKLEPRGAGRSRRPGAVVPFYQPDGMAGFDLKKRKPLTENRVIQFGRHLVQQGYVVVCTEAFPYNTVPEPQNNKGFAWWQAAADVLLSENPGWTGIAKLAWDTSLAVDYLLSQERIDPERIVCIGHSLGGKMAFYAGALDDRIKAVIGSDFGLGFGFTNWDAPWYLGDRIQRPDFPWAHHHVLALMAPRSFLLIGGEADRPASWQYLNAVQPVYQLFGRAEALGFFDHAAGHRPTEAAVRLAYRWLAEQFDLPERPWNL